MNLDYTEYKMDPIIPDGVCACNERFILPRYSFWVFKLRSVFSLNKFILDGIAE